MVSALPGRPTGRLDRRDAQLPTAQAPPTQAAPDPSGRRGEQTLFAGTGCPDLGRVNISPGPGRAPDCQRFTPRARCQRLRPGVHEFVSSRSRKEPPVIGAQSCRQISPSMQEGQTSSEAESDSVASNAVRRSAGVDGCTRRRHGQAPFPRALPFLDFLIIHQLFVNN